LTDNSKMPAPVPTSSAGESDLRRRLSAASNINEKVTLEVALVQELHNRGDTASAMKEMDKAVKLDPDRDILWLMASLAHKQGGDLQGAKLALEEYVRRAPDNAPA